LRLCEYNLVMTATPPSTPHITGYTISRHLARGGMAEVFVAEHITLRRQVALKVLRVADAGGADAVERFEQETRLIAELSHPNIVGIHDVGRSSDGALYYAMPFLPGGDLTARVSPLSSADIRKLLTQLLDALGYAHGKGIVHRDIKPANVLFDEHGTPQLADFGVAIRTLNSERLTQVGLTVGSTGYMSPEQARGMPVDARADLYSVGVLAYELLTGSLPFQGIDAFEVAIAQLEKAVPRLPKQHAQWQGFINKALARQPAQRFQNAVDMTAALARIPEAPSRIAGLSRTPTIALAAVFAGAVLGLAAWALWPKTQMSAADIRQLIAAEQLLPPDRPNALDSLIAAPAQADFDLLRAQLEDKLRAPLRAAIDARRWDEVERRYTPWQDANVRLRIAPATRAAVANNLDRALRVEFDRAIAAYDKTDAEPALALFALMDKPSTGLADRHALLLKIPKRADGIVDADGPKLSVIKAPTYTSKGTAVSVIPVSAALYARYAGAARRTPASCGDAGAAAAVAQCVSYAEAKDFVRWFAEQSGQSYRLPSVAEWQAANRKGLVGEGLVGVSPVVRVWSRDCNSVRTVSRPNALRRGLGKVRKVFGGRGAGAQVSQDCQGQLSLGALGADSASTAHAASHRSSKIGIGLVRDLAALTRPAD
jgi:serine/threonine-protein kinase PpkA